MISNSNAKEDTSGLLPDALNVKWIHGSPNYRNRTDPPIQVQWYNSDTVIMRESKDISFEAPFMYLLFGNRRALLLDTGTTSDPVVFPVRTVVDKLVDEWVRKERIQDYELVVAHTHGHNDHTSGDSQFAGRPNTRIIQKDQDSVRAFFGLNDWPNGVAEFDLGERILEVFPSPGHDHREITIYDPSTEFLFTGDTIYPGRFYVFDFPAYVGTLKRILNFSRERKVKYLLGSHIEMSNVPGKDYPITSIYQPDEPPLPMTIEQLERVKNAAEDVSNKRGVHRYSDFLIFNGPCYGTVLRQFIQAKLYNFKHKHQKN